MRTKICSVIFASFVIICSAYGQQRPQFTQYIFNNYLLNPALTGIERYTDVKLGYRSQWAGLNGAPVTSFFSVNAPIGNGAVPGDANSFADGSEQNPFSRSYLLDYRAAQPHHGIGMAILSDKAGAVSETNFNLTYAYHIGLSSTLNLSVGLSAGFSHRQINTAMLTTTDPDDAALNNLNANQWQPDIGIGVWAYAAQYFAGFSVQQAYTRPYFDTGNSLVNNNTVPHFYMTGGLKLFLTEDISLIPSALIKYTRPVPLSYDLNAKLAFSNKFWIGGSYRKNDTFIGMAGFNLGSFLNISYGYDVNNTALRGVSSGSHEIVLGLLLNKSFKLNCPEHSF